VNFLITNWFWKTNQTTYGHDFNDFIYTKIFGSIWCEM